MNKLNRSMFDIRKPYSYNGDDIEQGAVVGNLLDGFEIVNHAEHHKKYWRVRYNQDEQLLIREWGRIGNSPQRKEEYKSPSQAIIVVIDLVDSKFRKGYRTQQDTLRFLLGKEI